MLIRRIGERTVNKVVRADFGLVTEFNRRRAMKFTGSHLIPNKAQFFVTPSRPGNFGDHIDFKPNVDNWFDDNRVHNEHDNDHRRAQFYILTAMFYSCLLNYLRLWVVAGLGRLNGWKRYDRNTYMEVDISEVPPGEVLQIAWNGEPVFVRRLTELEYLDEKNNEKGLLDPNAQVLVTKALKTYILVCSAICTHLGCVPIPYLGAYNGWVCICHGSVYDKFGRVRQGPALNNLPMINNSAFEEGNLLCIEALKFPREPSRAFWTQDPL